MTLEVTPEKLGTAAARAKRDFIYEHTLSELCIELVKLQVSEPPPQGLRSFALFRSPPSQEHVKSKGLKVCVLFEGRDAAGKGGVISRIASAMSPRICRVVALSAPSERERTQWCAPSSRRACRPL